MISYNRPGRALLLISLALNFVLLGTAIIDLDGLRHECGLTRAASRELRESCRWRVRRNTEKIGGRWIDCKHALERAEDSCP